MANDKTISIILEVNWDFKSFLEHFKLKDNEHTQTIWNKMCENADYNKKTNQYEIREDGSETEYHTEMLEEAKNCAEEEVMTESAK